MFDLDISAGLSSQWDQATSSHQSPVLVFTVKVYPARVFWYRPLRAQSSKRAGSSPHDKSLLGLNFSPSSRGSGDNVYSGVPPAGSAESWELSTSELSVELSNMLFGSGWALTLKKGLEKGAMMLGG